MLLGDFQHPLDMDYGSPINHLLPRSLRHLEVLSWPRDLSPSPRLLSIMESSDFSRPSIIVLECSGEYSAIRQDVLGWTSSQEGGNFVFRRFKATEVG